MADIPYTYLIGWSKFNTWYYGVRYAKNCNPNELWIKYFTSSKEVQKFRKLNGEPDIIEIREIFINKYKARKWEHKVLRRLQIVNNSKWLNLCTGEAPPIMFGPCSETRKTNIKLSRLMTPKIECKYCGILADPGNIKQFHNENCKHGPNYNTIIHNRQERSKKSYNSQIKNGTYKKPRPLHGKFICPHCRKVGTNYGAMKRFHFDRCPVNAVLLHQT